MKAIIMAGGEGTRLRPITSVMPKPAVPVCDKPAIIHIIQLLEKHGINNIAVTLVSSAQWTPLMPQLKSQRI